VKDGSFFMIQNRYDDHSRYIATIQKTWFYTFKPCAHFVIVIPGAKYSCTDFFFHPHRYDDVANGGVFRTQVSHEQVLFNFDGGHHRNSRRVQHYLLFLVANSEFPGRPANH
jgi:hypothetical protein